MKNIELPKTMAGIVTAKDHKSLVERRELVIKPTKHCSTNLLNTV